MKEMKVASIDERDLRGHMLGRLGRGEAAEAAADENDAMRG